MWKKRGRKRTEDADIISGKYFVCSFIWAIASVRLLYNNSHVAIKVNSSREQVPALLHSVVFHSPIGLPQRSVPYLTENLYIDFCLVIVFIIEKKTLK